MSNFIKGLAVGALGAFAITRIGKKAKKHTLSGTQNASAQALQRALNHYNRLIRTSEDGAFVVEIKGGEGLDYLDFMINDAHGSLFSTENEIYNFVLKSAREGKTPALWTGSESALKNALQKEDNFITAHNSRGEKIKIAQEKIKIMPARLWYHFTIEKIADLKGVGKIALPEDEDNVLVLRGVKKKNSRGVSHTPKSGKKITLQELQKIAGKYGWKVKAKKDIHYDDNDNAFFTCDYNFITPTFIPKSGKYEGKKLGTFFPVSYIRTDGSRGKIGREIRGYLHEELLAFYDETMSTDDANFQKFREKTLKEGYTILDIMKKEF